jgi:hypothetical protein
MKPAVSMYGTNLDLPASNGAHLALQHRHVTDGPSPARRLGLRLRLRLRWRHPAQRREVGINEAWSVVSGQWPEDERRLRERECSEEQADLGSLGRL